MIAGVLLAMKQLEIHGKWWNLFYSGFWVYLGVRTCDVFFFVLVPHPGVWFLFNLLLSPCFLCYL